MKCKTCNITKQPTDFAWRNKKNNKKATQCRQCKAVYDHNDWFGGPRKAQMRSRSKYYRNMDYTRDFLMTHPCVDCGESNPGVLDFDHIDRSKKRQTVSDMCRRLVSIETLQEEMDKCEIRCACCHRIKTAIELGYYAWRPKNEQAGYTWCYDTLSYL